MKEEKLSESVVVGKYATIMDAEIARSILSSSEIDSFINNPSISTMYPSLSTLQQVELLVRAEDADLAIKIINADFVKE